MEDPDKTEGQEAQETQPVIGIQDVDDVIPSGGEPIIQDMLEEGEGEPEPTPTPEGSNDSVLESIKSILNEGLNPEENTLLDFDAETVEKFPTMTGEEKKGVLFNSLLNHVQLGKDEKVDALVRSIIQKSYEDDFDLDALIQETPNDTGVHKWESNSLDDNFKFAYTRTYGKGTSANMTDEEIAEEIESQSVGFKKAFVADFRKGEEQSVNELKARAAQEEQKRIDTFVNKHNESMQSKITELVESSKDKQTLSGFHFSQADKDDYLKELPAMLERKLVVLENGDKYAISEAEQMIAELTQNGQSIMELMPFLYLRKTGKMEAYSTMLSNKLKEEIIGKLEETPVNPGGHNAKPAKRNIQDTE